MIFFALAYGYINYHNWYLSSLLAESINNTERLLKIIDDATDDADKKDTSISYSKI